MIVVVRLADKRRKGFALHPLLPNISENCDTCTIHRELLGDLASNVSSQIEKIISEPLHRDQNERGAILGRSTHQIDGISASTQFRTLCRNLEDPDSLQFQTRTRHSSKPR